MVILVLLTKKHLIQWIYQMLILQVVKFYVIKMVNQLVFLLMLHVIYMFGHVKKHIQLQIKKIRGIVQAQQELLKLGLTSIHDASILGEDAQLYVSQVARQPKVLNEFLPNGENHNVLYDPFPMRVYGMIDVEGTCAPHGYQCPDPFPFSQISFSSHLTFQNGTAFAKPKTFSTQQRETSPALNVLPKITDAANGKFSMNAAKLLADGALGYNVVHISLKNILMHQINLVHKCILMNNLHVLLNH
eukprot:UN04445